MYTIEELEKECIRRFGEDWRNVKVESCAFNGKANFINKRGFGDCIDTSMIWSKHACLYNKGKWATPLNSDIHTDIQSLKDKYPQFNITVSVEEQ